LLPLPLLLIMLLLLTMLVLLLLLLTPLLLTPTPGNISASVICQSKGRRCWGALSQEHCPS
jgi:hypothetical protein